MRKHQKLFFQYVIPSVIAFALSGVYAIVDGFFVGNKIGDAGLSAINVAYPIVALIQSAGTGIGLGGAVHYTISKAEQREDKARAYLSVTWRMLLICSFILTILVCSTSRILLSLMGADGQIASYGSQYLFVIGLGSYLQVFGTGLIPIIRNDGGSFWAMVSMGLGFITNIILDDLLVMVIPMGMTGAAIATIIGQGVTMAAALIYTFRRKLVILKTKKKQSAQIVTRILSTGLAPFGLAMTPNISLIITNRFSASYGGAQAIADFAVISYVTCVIYLILQGVGDGSQPLMSMYYGKKETDGLKAIQRMAYLFSLILAFVGCALIYAARYHIGTLFGSSPQVNADVAQIIRIFLISIPFDAITKVTTSSFYATEKNALSYILTFMEPVMMLILMAVLAPMGGQNMIWWSAIIAKIISAMSALFLKQKESREIQAAMAE
ncbi:MAG: MATE family efflux transporter [Lactimicrobium sp.]|uniref:MATE family efflux transporter n=1 Tax=Lactimicrobium sp. TaxID=2563780 RepID=UPI002F35A7F2